MTDRKSPKPAEQPAQQVLGDAKTSAPAATEQTVTYSISPGLAPLLARLNVSIAFSSYQSGKFYLMGRNPEGGIMINERFFKKAMGFHATDDGFLLATLQEIICFENVLDDGQFINHTYDACFVPRTVHITGALDTHDIGETNDGRIVFVNTAYNCVAEISPRHSFKPVWKPDFVSKIVCEDRCHLNGMAMGDGRPRYVTAISRSDTIDGWRDRRANGGIVIDVMRNEVVCSGLSMPHSPRLHAGKLWVLNSGTGELGWVELGENSGEGQFHALCFCPGFVRGLGFYGDFAFVGLSKPRYERFEGLELDRRLQETDSEPWCGVQVIDLKTGRCVEWFRVDGAIGELYDVGVLAGVVCPMSLGFTSDEIAGFITHDAWEDGKTK